MFTYVLFCKLEDFYIFRIGDGLGTFRVHVDQVKYLLTDDKLYSREIRVTVLGAIPVSGKCEGRQFKLAQQLLTSGQQSTTSDITSRGPSVAAEHLVLYVIVASTDGACCVAGL